MWISICARKLALITLQVAFILISSTNTVSAVDSRETLLVHGSMDLSAMKFLLEGFSQVHPDIDVRYVERSTREVFEGLLEAAQAGRATADVLLSSAMDLQTKLANDGHVLAYESPHEQQLPDWAVWRDEAFAFSFEPIVIVYNPSRLDPDMVPTSRYRLIELLNQKPHTFFGKVATFDPNASGVGYLALTQDSEQSPVMHELTTALGQIGVQLFGHSAAMLDRIATGELTLAYNVIGAYALSRARTDPRLVVVLPEDYTLVISRIALVPKTTNHPELAFRFVDFLLSVRGQQILAGPAGLFAIRSGVTGESTMEGLSRAASGVLRPVRVGPGLLVYLDPIKREKFLDRWSNALQRRPAFP